MIHEEIGAATSQGVHFLKMAKPTAVASGPAQLRAFRDSGSPVYPACLEFEPQNLGIVSVNTDGQIVEANDAFFSMSGYSQTDLPLEMAAITPAEWHELDDQKSQQLANDGRCLPWQKQILTRQGHQLPIVIGAAALNLTDNQFQYFIANTEDLLHTDSVILEYQAQLRSTAVELSLSAERERRAIAGDLHDNIGQELAIAKLRLSKMRAETTGKIGAELDEITAQLSNALGSCRRLSHALATPSLYELGLVPALKNLVATLYRDQQISVSLHFDNEDVPFSTTTSIILYRVIRELLINILKHAQASNVEISGTRDGKMFKVIVADDGIGCDLPKTMTDTSLEQGVGLFLVRERLWHIGGSFEFESTAGKGTKVTLVAPLDDATNSLGPIA